MPPANKEPSTPAELQWKRLRKLRLEGTRLSYLTRVTPVDRLLARTVLPFVPASFSPNAITTFRFVCVPFVLLFLLTGHTALSFSLFIIAALSDALDGALARTRREITKWGIIADPIADKLLVGTVAVTAISKYLTWQLAAVIVGIELVLVTTAYLRYRGKLIPAKVMGKAKMVLQCVGVGLVLLYSVYSATPILVAGQYVLYAAVVFAVLSLFAYRSI